MGTILVADDHKQITSILEEYLKKEGYEVIIAQDGQETIELFELHQPDLILLDVMMPEMDGFSVCREIRKSSDVPIIIITARGEDFEKIMGLDIGADDYIVKPFSAAEVMARVRALLRRVDGAQEVITIGSLMVDQKNYQATIQDETIRLTKKELEILWLFAKNPNKVFSRENLLDSVWGDDYFGDYRTVDTHIKRLRAKTDQVNHPDWSIETIWGVGYQLQVQSYEK